MSPDVSMLISTSRILFLNIPTDERRIEQALKHTDPSIDEKHNTVVFSRWIVVGKNPVTSGTPIPAVTAIVVAIPSSPN